MIKKAFKFVFALGFLIVMVLIIIHYTMLATTPKKKVYHLPIELNYFHGKVLNEKLLPLDSIRIKILGRKQTWFTDKKGYFKTDSHKIIPTDTLLFFKKGYKTDSIKVFSNNYQGYLADYYLFSRKELDTIILYKE